MSAARDYVTVFRGRLVEAEMLLGKLRSAGIEAYVWDANFTTAVAPGLLGEARLVVPGEEAARVSKIISD
jgi:hypothetical protein